MNQMAEAVSVQNRASMAFDMDMSPGVHSLDGGSQDACHDDGSGQDTPKASSKTNSPCSSGHSDLDDVWSLDGASDITNHRSRPPTAAIFIHAGAGYHSVANERVHLEACSQAARVGMKLLRAGHSAVEAVEAAIKLLEDNEITNAGFGSNLSIDGTVECDATLVDHYGRSGACGAVSNIKNPITLARAILESSTKPLSLRRVPPNLLVGEGAKDFGWQSGLPLVPNEYIVSRNAHDRFLRWQDDLKRAENRAAASTTVNEGMQPPNPTDHDPEPRRDHTNAILTGTWNEGQPDSPTATSPWEPPSFPLPAADQRPSSTPNGSASLQATSGVTTERGPLGIFGLSGGGSKSASANMTPPTSKRQRFLPTPPSVSPSRQPRGNGKPSASKLASHDGANDIDDNAMETWDGQAHSHGVPMPSSTTSHTPGDFLKEDREDRITDTVGAIAIDLEGHMSAGSSSGGIGMKHRGRVGPAALVGVGTAIIPARSDDEDETMVAAVTSGTGEHMATTMAAQRCAERLYHGTRRGPGGRDIPESIEDFVLRGFIVQDFQEHPGVKNTPSPGAIGIMAVKKTSGGYYLHFAHNTDSFALAAMGSNDRKPSQVMSRLNSEDPITHGGMKI
ncbi:nucleophile aminohydrolase [Xylariomycetidae sp. FL0641]|nr:nucleophile aminohydrolase [Xylariomycetidae sp. FL0641]